MFTRNEALSRFEVSADGHSAFLEYSEEDNRLELVHTEVPEALGGRGIAGELARGAFAYARERGMRVRVTCEFVRGWLERHPEERDLVDDDGAG